MQFSLQAMIYLADDHDNLYMPPAGQLLLDACNRAHLQSFGSLKTPL
jgi:hypothetical protein